MSNDAMDLGISVLVYKNGSHSSDGTIPWKEFTYDTKSSTSENIVRSIVDGLASLLDGNGFIDKFGFAVIRNCFTNLAHSTSTKPNE